jgi:hypothetical protein
MKRRVVEDSDDEVVGGDAVGQVDDADFGFIALEQGGTADAKKLIKTNPASGKRTKAADAHITTGCAGCFDLPIQFKHGVSMRRDTFADQAAILAGRSTTMSPRVGTKMEGGWLKLRVQHCLS